MWRIAWRNLWRNRTRSLIAATSVSLSFALMLISFGTADATYEQTREAAVKTAGGAVLVHGDGWWQARTTARYVAEAARVREAALAIDGVEAATARVIATGLLSSPRANQGVELRGIDPAEERRLQDFSKWISEGEYVEAGDGRGIVLGAGLAKKLSIGLGDRVVFTSTDPQGEMQRALFRVRGLLETGTDALDDAAAFASIEAAQDALGLGDGVTQVGLVLAPDADRVEVARRLRGALGGAYEILTWDEAMPELVGFIEADKAFSWLFGALIFLVVGFGIANTFLMAVLERVRELGLLGALGLTPGGIARLVLAESVSLAAFSLAVGYALGFAGHLYLSRVGVDIAALSGAEMELGGVVLEELALRSVIDPVRWSGAAVGVVMVIVASALYPAWRASRLDPAQAMRTFE